MKQIGPRVAIVSMKTISENGNILCPHYYLNTHTKDCLIEILEHTEVEHLTKKIESIIETGSLITSSLWNNKIRINTAFISKLAALWYGDRAKAIGLLPEGAVFKRSGRQYQRGPDSVLIKCTCLDKAVEKAYKSITLHQDKIVIATA